MRYALQRAHIERRNPITQCGFQNSLDARFHTVNELVKLQFTFAYEFAQTGIVTIYLRESEASYLPNVILPTCCNRVR